jgi:hypothetical protein
MKQSVCLTVYFLSRVNHDHVLVFRTGVASALVSARWLLKETYLTVSMCGGAEFLSCQATKRRC